MCWGCTPTTQRVWSFGLGAVFLAFAITLGVLWPSISTDLINKELSLVEYSTNYKNWIKSPFSLYMEFYLFNWTNWEEFHVPNENGEFRSDIKPKFEELGPYVFEEIHERVGIVYDDDGNEIAFNQTKTWWFREDLSNGTLDDQITSINPVALTTAYFTRYLPDTLKGIIDALLMQLSKMFITASVKEWIFDGFDEGILEWIQDLIESGELPPGLPIPEIPYDKFGWFALRNGSAEYDKRFEMFTGKDDIKKLGILKSWDGKTELGVMSGECDKIKGTTGELWPPFNRNKKEDAVMFIPDVCRSLTLKYEKESKIQGIKGWKWIGDESMFDNGEKYPENKCYCQAETEEECSAIKSGIFNASACQYGAPSFASFPHFYLADESYLEAVEGLSPDKEKHEMYITLEPEIGLPLEIRARLQINLFLRNDPMLSFYKNVPDVYIPMFWFTQIADLPKDLADEAKMIYVVQGIGLWIAYGMFAISIFCLIMGVIFVFYYKKSPIPDKRPATVERA
uniref:CSON002486 protein n=1 Tax=Culicoides sonorensis TaxID=179676 RepID=A0A336L1I8_CULSO